jgi:hypothetical protein
MNIREIETKVRTPHIKVPVEVDGKTVYIDCPQITVGDWKDIKDDPHSGFDQWENLLNMSAGVDESSLTGKSKKEQAAIRNKMGLDLFKKLDHGIQLAMFYKAFQREDPEITREQVDRIISYGITDKTAYIKAMMFLVNGVKQEDIEAMDDDNPLAGSKENTNTKTEP